MNRRRFLSTSSGLTALATVAGSTRSFAQTAGFKSGTVSDSVQHIIHLVVDGMSWGTLTCSDHLSWQVRERGLTWLKLAEHPDTHSGIVNMRSLNSLVTDSSAAASAWGCGALILNGGVNVNSEGLPLTMLYELFGQKGWHRGLVTTAEITHATPAGFASNVVSRSMGEQIAENYLQHQVEVLMGGARQHFALEKRRDKKDLFGAYLKAGYTVCHDRDELLKGSPTPRWLGVFSEGHMPYTVDHQRDLVLQRTVPTLAEMTSKALEHLEQQEHFILQVEGGRVDHACHANDAAAAFFDMISFDEALDVCLAFQKRHPQTLIVATTDHGNANPALNGMGPSYSQSSQSFRRLADFKGSSGVLLSAIRKAGSLGEMASIIESRTGYLPEEARLKNFIPYLTGNSTALFDQLQGESAGLGQLLANFTGIGFTGTSHTSDYVPLLAVGPGSKRFAGMYGATRVFDHYTDLANIDHRNPQEAIIAHRPTPNRDRENVAEYLHV